MGIRIQNITDEAHQRHVVLIDDAEVVVTVRFLSPVQQWFVDVESNGRAATGFKLSLGVLHMRSQNFPFDFVVQDVSGTGLDPFKLDDFSAGRCILYMLDAADMEALRDAPVPI